MRQHFRPGFLVPTPFVAIQTMVANSVFGGDGTGPSLSYDPDAAGGTLTVGGGQPAAPSLAYDPDAAGGTLTVT